jgi:hypothetical protein
MALTTASPDLGLAVIERGQQALSIAQMQSRSMLIRQVMANVLEEGKDYGRIPGTDKPTLYKPGAEKLCLTFALAAAEPIIDDLSTSDASRYRVSVPIKNTEDRVLAVGIGSCSSDEEKYRWHRPVCDEEFEETPAHLRRLKWFKGKDGGKAWQGKQIRTSPADVDNTILKMGHKRAFIAATLLATGASSVFNQDLEDFAEELRENVFEGEADETTAPKTVKRASEKKPATAAAELTAALKVRDVRAWGTDKNNWSVLLVGVTTEYTTRDQNLALELEKFKGTDHLVRLAFLDNESGGKTYHNIKSFSVVEPAPAPPPPAPATGPMTAGDIPFSR